MKKLLSLVLMLSLISCKSSHVDTFDPSGTYKLGNFDPESADDIKGYFGEIQVKQIAADKVAMTFMINKGAPAYNYGAFMDTLSIENKVAIYRTPEFDESCTITFRFDPEGVKVHEETDNYNSGCGFGHAVVANGYFKKTTSEIPVLRNPMTGEEL
ncbi:hypothetical protein JRG66_13340 [Salinimicrobium tongyeongense]|uniref:Uncharacterized protein n=1 Tax=Salinimicrobium tongyeongense TaxID=2809707 RepID=A0ABY6NPW4_9FLAO|nr:hypothetical protein [Salinimicrobium tongyeongense]UZH54935.1 hypothetical protein JRG66_13340 [Salinimicrobium tongyeongense]